MTLTLLLGWWGLFALFFRNPFAIVSNMRALFGPPVAPQEFGGLPLRTAYPSEAEREHQAAAVSGLVPDTWHCALCDSYIVGEDNVQRHADRSTDTSGTRRCGTP